jgi:hypothetical protein
MDRVEPASRVEASLKQALAILFFQRGVLYPINPDLTFCLAIKLRGDNYG